MSARYLTLKAALLLGLAIAPANTMAQSADNLFAKKTVTIFIGNTAGGSYDLYGRMVAAGLWRDYAIDFGKDAASFSAFKRTAERPSARIEKRPALRAKQGMWALYGEAGQVLKRGQELASLLSPLERKLMKVVED
jgi:hypothetical protein